MRPEVTLLRHTPEPTRAMALAARLCYTQGQTIASVDAGLTDAECERLVLKILSNRHLGVLEHAVFTFGVEGVSRDFSHQMVRHRNTSYDQQSLHYTLAPEGFEMAQPIGMSEEDQTDWDLLKERAFRLYTRLVKRGAPREEARHILPGGIQTRLIMTANLRQWLSFVEVRSCVVNCREIEVVALRVKRLLEDLMPYLKDHLGPTCWTRGVCHEGKKFCEAPWRDECLVTGDGMSRVWGRAR